MSEMLYKIMGKIAKIHSRIMAINDNSGYDLTDKQLHFIVIGILGIGAVLIIHPIFKWLANHGHTMVITWIFVFSMVLVVTFAIEIGQRLTHTGMMEFDDIVFGVVGFLVFFFIFALIRAVLKGIASLFK